MKMKLSVMALGLALFATGAVAAPPPPPPEPGEVAIEIYRIAPGQQEAFLKLTALYDEANRQAGLPPRQLYVHEDGASWDFIFIQPEHNPPGKSKLVGEALDRLKAPRGANFFLETRKYIAEHTDTAAIGPTTAADYLATVTH
jgi:hypothetical protein